MKSFNKHFIDICKKYENKIAIQDSKTTLTYGNLFSLVLHNANILRKYGVRENDNIIIMLNNSVEAIVSILSVIMSGGTYVPINVKDAIERKIHIINDSGSKLLITNEVFSSEIRDKNLNIRTVLYEDLLNESKTNNESDVFISPEGNMYILYTSGSTGIPKGVMITHNNLMSQMESLKEKFNFTSNDVWSQFHTICFDFSVLEIFGSLYNGATLQIVPDETKLNSKKLIEFIKAKKISIFGLVPSVMYKIPEDLITDSLSVRLMILGGEKLSFNKLKVWFNVLKNLKVVNGYGLTETTIFNTGKVLDKNSQLEEESNIGKAFGVNEVILYEGEILLGGPVVCKGYLNREELNKEKFIIINGKRYFRTGDLGRITPDGEIVFIGRKDNQVKIRGFRIEIEEIENKLRLIKNIKEAAVKVDDKKQLIIAFIVLANKNVELNEIVNQAKIKIPAYMMPNRWIIINKMPLTERGKTDKDKLSYSGREGIIERFEDCENETQKKLHILWSEEFKDIDFGVNESFYSLGGNSLSVMNMLENIQHIFNKKISLVDFIANPTIKNLSNLIEKAGDETYNKDLLIKPSKKLVKKFPQTDLQQSFFIGRQANIKLGNCASHNYSEIECNTFDATKFNNIIRKLTERHPLLRCSFDELGNHIISDEIEFDIPYHDLTGLDKDSQKIEILKTRERMKNLFLPFDKAPLVRIEVDLLSKTKSIIHLYIDALICDGFSYELLLNEADRLYSNELTVLENNDFYYSDYVEYSKSVKNTFSYEKAKKFWLARIEDLPDNPDLQRNVIDDTKKIESEQYKVLIKYEDWNKIEDNAKALGLSSFIVTFTAFCKAIAKYSSNQRFVINLPVSNRPNICPEISNLFGVCSNFYLFDFQNNKNESLYETAIKVQKDMWTLKENESFTGNEIIREIYNKTGNVGDYVASIVFTTLLDSDYRKKEKLIPVYLETHTTQIWMDTVLIRELNGVSFNCDYVKGLLDIELIKNILSDCVYLLNEFAKDGNSWSKISCIPQNKKEKEILKKINSESKNYNNSDFYQRFLKVCNENPNGIAIKTSTTQLSYSDLLNKINLIRNEILSFKFSKNIAIVCEKDWYQIAAIMATISLNKVYIPIDKEFPEKTISYCLEVSDADIVLTDSRNLKKLDSYYSDVRSIILDKIDYENNPANSFISVNRNFNDDFVIIFTSGTTGYPKAIRLNQEGILNSIDFTIDHYKINNADKALALTNICHDMSMFDMFAMLSIGGCVIIPEQNNAKNPYTWIELIRKECITIINSVPGFMEMIFATEQNNLNECLSSLRLVIQGGDFLSPFLASQICNINNKIRLVNVGGPTETSLWSIYHDVKPYEILERKIPYGKPISNMEHYVLNTNLEIVPFGVIGTIYSSGVGLAKEYIKQPELTKEKFIYINGKRFFNTGDLAFYNSEGELMICGRKDNQIKINGKRIELEEIENNILKIKHISNSAVVYNKEKKTLVLFYISQHVFNEVEIKQELKSYVPDYMIPNYIFKLDALPITRNGKIDRNNLIIKSNELIEKSNESLVVKNVYNEIPELLFNKISTILNNKNINSDSNFFMEGGNSILAIRILSFINKEYNVKLSIGDLFEHPVIGEWYNLIKNNKNNKFETNNENYTLNDKIPLSPAQTGIYFYENIHRDSKFTICFYSKITGNIDIMKLKRCINFIVNKNPVFNYNYFYDERNNKAYQFINNINQNFNFEIINIKCEKDALGILKKESEYKFDLKKERLYRFILLRLPNNNYYLVGVMHHLICDETSIEVLYNNIIKFYNDEEIESSSLSYEHYCFLKENKSLISSIKPDFAYVNPEAALCLRKSYDAPCECRVKSFSIGLDQSEKLNSICGEYKITLYVALYSIFLASLYLETGSSELITTTAVSDRSIGNYTDTIGMFVYNQYISYKSNPEDSIDTVINNVKKQILDLYKNPLQAVNDTIRLNKLSESFMKFQNYIVFTYVDNDRKSYSNNKLTVSPVEIVKKIQDNVLNIIFERLNGKLIVNLYYQSDYVSDDFIVNLNNKMNFIINNFENIKNNPLINYLEKNNLVLENILEDSIF